MIKIENVEVVGWEHAIRGMRNPKNSWEKSDSGCCADLKCTECSLYSKEESCCDHEGYFILGENDHKLTTQLAAGGPVHAKYRRMIVVYLDITAPLYWWKEFDTYKVGTVANSCSTMHKIHEREFTLDDFSCEHLDMDGREILEDTINVLNISRAYFNENKAKNNWWQMIQLLPSSYNQKRTVMLNYEVLANIYKSRKNHKLDEWRELCKWIESLPYAELITGKVDNNKVKSTKDMTLAELIEYYKNNLTILGRLIKVREAINDKGVEEMHEITSTTNKAFTDPDAYLYKEV